MTDFKTFIVVSPLAMQTKTGIFGLFQEDINTIADNFTEKVNISDMLDIRIKEMISGKVNKAESLITPEMVTAIVDYVDGLNLNNVQKGIITYKLIESTHITAVIGLKRLSSEDPLKALKVLLDTLKDRGIGSEPSLN
jgi:predicted S18 family serine protease